jgi:hypothetical protein
MKERNKEEIDRKTKVHFHLFGMKRNKERD